MSTMKIKKGDTVKVIAGKDLGTEGKVLSVDVKNHKVLVEGVNKITKHAKPSQANPNGGIVEKEAPIDISNVMLVVKGMLNMLFDCNYNSFIHLITDNFTSTCFS